MLKILTSQTGMAESIAEKRLENKINQLNEAKKLGADFLLLPIHENLTAIEWILASFYSPIAVVPYSAQLPLAAKENILQSLPKNKVIELPELEKISTSKATLPPFVEKKLSDIWAVIFTSGSSGNPKGVALSGSSLKESASAHHKHLQLKESDSWLLNLPLYHVGGLSVVTRAYFNRSIVAIASTKFDLAETINWIQSGKISGISLVPTILKRILDSHPNIHFKSIKHVLVGGASTDHKLIERANLMGLPIYLTYGMTENCSQIATEFKSGDGLQPLPGVEIQISNENEILISTPCLFSGYFSEGKFFPIKLTNGIYFPTGDLGLFTNKRLFVSGRKSDLIISGGINIFPSEIELPMAEFQQFSDFAICSIPHEEWGEQVVAAYSAQNPKRNIIENAKSFLASKIDPKKLPKQWILLPQIPRTSNGKVKREELKKLVLKNVSLD